MFSRRHATVAVVGALGLAVMSPTAARAATAPFIIPSPISLSAVSGRGYAVPGDQIDRSITVANVGDLDATTVVLTNTLLNLSGPTLLMADGTACGGACQLGDHTVTAALGT